MLHHMSVQYPISAVAPVQDKIALPGWVAVVGGMSGKSTAQRAILTCMSAAARHRSPKPRHLTFVPIRLELWCPSSKRTNKPNT
eukprot:4275558-Amphidinium_carterae.1